MQHAFREVSILSANCVQHNGNVKSWADICPCVPKVCMAYMPNVWHPKMVQVYCCAAIDSDQGSLLNYIREEQINVADTIRQLRQDDAPNGKEIHARLQDMLRALQRYCPCWILL